MFYYTGLDIFVHDARQSFWTWVQFPSSPPYKIGSIMKKEKFQYNGEIVEISPYRVIEKDTKERKWVAKVIVITSIGSSQEYRTIFGSKNYDTEKEAKTASIVIAKKCIDGD